MKAMVLEALGEVKPPQAPLRLVHQPEPTLRPGEILLRVTRCGVCHTELDEIEGRTPPPQLPVILGHQVVGIVEESSGDLNRSVTTEPTGVLRTPSLAGGAREGVPTGQRVGVA